MDEETRWNVLMRESHACIGVDAYSLNSRYGKYQGEHASWQLLLYWWPDAVGFEAWQAYATPPLP